MPGKGAGRCYKFTQPLTQGRVSLPKPDKFYQWWIKNVDF